MRVLRNKRQLDDLPGGNAQRLGLADRDFLRRLVGHQRHSVRPVGGLVCANHRGVFRRGVGLVGRRAAAGSTLIVCRAVRVLGQHAIAQDGAVGTRILARRDRVVGVALDGLDGKTALLLHDLGHDAHVVGHGIAVTVEEHEVTRLRGAVSRACIEVRALQLLDPVAAAGVKRDGRLGHARIVQAERGKHGAPVGIGHAIPRTVARVAVYGVVLAHLVVGGALCIAQLALGHRHDVLGPVVAQVLGQGALPDVSTLNVSLRVRIASQGMLVLLKLAHQAVLVASVGMGMPLHGRRPFSLLLTANQMLLRLIAALVVRVTPGLFQPAGQRLGLRVAAFVVDVVVTLLQTAGEGGFVGIAFGTMRVGGLLLLPADKGAHRLIARVGVRVGGHGVCALSLFQPASQDALVARIGVLVGLFAAVRLAGHGGARENECVGGAEHHDAREGRHDVTPALYPQVLL